MSQVFRPEQLGDYLRPSTLHEVYEDMAEIVPATIYEMAPGLRPTTIAQIITDLEEYRGPTRAMVSDIQNTIQVLFRAGLDNCGDAFLLILMAVPGRRLRSAVAQERADRLGRAIGMGALVYYPHKLLEREVHEA